MMSGSARRTLYQISLSFSVYVVDTSDIVSKFSSSFRFSRLRVVESAIVLSRILSGMKEIIYSNTFLLYFIFYRS